jgi:iron complex outermembrane recepter protein
MKKNHSIALTLLALANHTAFGQAAGDATAPTGFPVVLTPARLKQGLPDVPASVTVITSDTLREFGILTVPDALRMVPGMEITQIAGGEYRINYHGTNVLAPRRLNVLIDGVSAYQPLFARVDWGNLPVAIEDIDRIEVSRGPNSAAYGPGSMMAIVNIITKHPVDVERFAAAATSGSNGTLSATARLGFTAGAATMRLTFNRDGDRGFDTLSLGNRGHDSNYFNRASFRGEAPLGNSTSLDLNASYVEGTKQAPFVEPYETSYPDAHVHEYFAEATLTHSFAANNDLQVRAQLWQSRIGQSWNSCPPTALLLPQLGALFKEDPSAALTLVSGKMPTATSPEDQQLILAAAQAIQALGSGALAPTCGMANQDELEKRVDFELQDTAVISDALRVVGGAGMRRDTGNSQTYLGGSRADNVYRLFANAEYRPTKAWTMNLGGYWEHDQMSGGSFSPRAAVNWHLDPTQTVRLVWSQGTRTPDVYEQTGRFSYTLSNAQPPLAGNSNPVFFETGQANGGLRRERDNSTELGYLLNIPTYGLVVDAKVFHDRLTDLVSDKLVLDRFNPINDGSVDLAGFEFQINAQIADDWLVFAQYGYLCNYNANTPLEQTQYSRHSGAVGVSHHFDGGWRATAAYYLQPGDGVSQSSYGRADFIVGKSFTMANDSRVDLSLLVRQFDHRTQSSYRDIAGSVYANSLNERTQVLGQVRLSF